MMGWLLILVLAAVVLLGLWRIAHFGRAPLQLVAAALLVAMAGYAWQGRPGLAGSPAPPPASQELPDTAFAATRERMLGTFDAASFWLRLADARHRAGDTYRAAAAIRAGIKAHPREADLWVGLGNALIIHADGMMNPAAELAFRRAAELAPGHPGPKFFYGLALAQTGKLEEAEKIWLDLLATSPPDVGWRPMVLERVEMIAQLRAMQRGALPQP
jgi:cytochrome c-type biogenesis protein CcmH/NrfG